MSESAMPRHRHRRATTSTKIFGGLAVTLPIAVFFVFVFGEKWIVGFIRHTIAGHWLNAPWGGVWLAWMLFIIGGFFLARFEAKHTKPNKPSRDPILWLGLKIHHALISKPRTSLLVNSLVVGPMYVGVILKHTNSAKIAKFAFYSSVLYALPWVALFTYVWK